MLEVPTDRSGLVEKGLAVLADFAGGWTLSKNEIDKERGVVLEEWRLGQGANSRLQRLQFPVLMHGSRYAERLPIGDPDVIRSFDPARLRAFAREWYRPERMAVAVVGDVDPAKAERWIQDKLGEVQAAEPGPARPVYDIPSHPRRWSASPPIPRRASPASPSSSSTRGSRRAGSATTAAAWSRRSSTRW